MMDHRAEALRLLESCQVDPGDERDAPTYPELEDDVNSIANALAAAQVHALLAVAAALQRPVPASPVAVEGSESAAPAEGAHGTWPCIRCGAQEIEGYRQFVMCEPCTDYVEKFVAGLGEAVSDAQGGDRG